MRAFPLGLLTSVAGRTSLALSWVRSGHPSAVLFLAVFAMLGTTCTNPRRQTEGYIRPTIGRPSQLVAYVPSANNAPNEYSQPAILRPHTPKRLLEETWLRFLATSRFDRAMTTLECARASHSATLLSDRAIIRMERGRKEREPFQLLLAAEDAAVAVHLDRRCAACWFNLALTLELIGLTETSLRAWTRFRALESDARWLEEANDRSAQLERSLTNRPWDRALADLQAGEVTDSALQSFANQFPYESYRFAEKQLTTRESPRLQTSHVDQGALAPSQELAHWLAVHFATDRGDWYLFDLIRGAELLADDSRQMRALRKFGRARIAYDQRDLAKAIDLLGQTLEKPDELPNPARLAALLLHAILIYLVDVDQARPLLTDLKPLIDSQRYPALAGELEWMLGTVAGVRGQLEQASIHYLRAKTLLTRSHGRRRAAAVDALIADLLDLSDRTSESWQHRILSVQSTRPGGRRRHAALIEAAESLRRHGQTILASLFLTELLGNALRWDQPEPLVESYVRLARLFQFQGDVFRARRSLMQARRVSHRLDTTTNRVAIDLAKAEAELIIELEPHRALRLLEDAKEAFRERGYHYERLSFLLSTTRALELIGDSDGALETLLTAASSLEGDFNQLRTGHHRLEFSDRRRKLYEQIVELLLKQGKTTAALTAVLALKNWNVETQHALETPRQRFDLDRFRMGLTPNIVVVVFFVQREQTVFWEVTREHCKVHILNLERERLEYLVAQAQRALLTNSERAEILHHIHRLLIDPLKLQRNVQRLHIVPDGPLLELPFSALQDPEDGAFLINKQILTASPSLSSPPYPEVLSHAFNSAEEPLHALVIGVSTANAKYPNLPIPTLAAPEARMVASIYSVAKLLEGSDANLEALSTGLREANVLHIAAHSLRDGPGLKGARIILYKSDLLTAEHIRALSKSELQLAFLSSCQSAEGYSGSRAGLTDLAMSFFTAGIPNVVGTLQNIDDSLAFEFATRFHRQYRLYADAPLAFTTTVRQLLHKQPEARYAWLSYVIASDLIHQ